MFWNTRTTTDMAVQDAAIQDEQHAYEEAAEAKRTYKRRADFSDLPLANQLGILRTELEMAETEVEIANAQAAIKHLEETIERVTPKEFVGDSAAYWKMLRNQ